MRSANVLRIGEASLWRSEVVVVGDREFFTSSETLLCFPESRLARLLSPPYPLLDVDRDVHVIPASLCRTPEAFEVILEFMRGPPQWPMISNKRLYNDVVDACKAFGIPQVPPPRYASEQVPLRYEYREVLIPAVTGVADRDVMGGGPSSSSSTVNSCAVISSLSSKGFSLVKEMSVDSSSQAMRALQASSVDLVSACVGGDVLRASATADISRFERRLRKKSTAVVLERRRAVLPLVDHMSSVSAWFSALSEAS